MCRTVVQQGVTSISHMRLSDEVSLTIHHGVIRRERKGRLRVACCILTIVTLVFIHLNIKNIFLINKKWEMKIKKMWRAGWKSGACADQNHLIFLPRLMLSQYKTSLSIMFDFSVFPIFSIVSIRKRAYLLKLSSNKKLLMCF